MQRGWGTLRNECCVFLQKKTIEPQCFVQCIQYTCRIRSYSNSVWSTDDEATKLTVLQVKDVRSATQNCSSSSMVLAHRAHDHTFYHHVMTPNGKRWGLLEELNDKPSDQAIQGLHVSKPCQNERKLLQSAKLLHEKQLRTHLATQNLQFFKTQQKSVTLPSELSLQKLCRSNFDFWNLIPLVKFQVCRSWRVGLLIGIFRCSSPRCKSPFKKCVKF